MLLFGTLLIGFVLFGSSSAYFADWSLLARDREPMCVPIPRNLSLCHNIGYTKMRLPNLLDHDTMQEVSQQATSWVPLLNIECHADTQLFLCSLFAPVCLERPIYPCRSLCQKVKAGCEGTMENYGFPWPTMLDCDKFPLDNDMCIASQSEKTQGEMETGNNRDGKRPTGPSGSHGPALTSTTPSDAVLHDDRCSAKACNQPNTYENILDNYCHSDFVVKMKFRRVRGNQINGRKVNTVFKTWRGTPRELRKLRKPRLELSTADECCSGWLEAEHKRLPQQRYLVMGKKDENGLVATFLLPWSKSKELRRARRMFKQIDCENLPQTSQRIMAEAMAPHTLFSKNPPSSQRLRHTESRNRRRTSSGKRRQKKSPKKRTKKRQN